MSYVSEVMADTPIFYARLDENSGTTASDSSGNGRNGTYTNTPSLGVPGLIFNDSDRAMGIAANTGQCVVVADNPWMDINSITVEALVRFSSATDVSNGDAIASRYTAGGGFNWLFWRNTAGRLAFQCRNTGGTVYNIADTVANVVLGQTYHAAASFDHVNNLVTLIVNGLPTTPIACTGTLQVGSSPIEVGRYSVANATTPGAVVDEVAVYGSALSLARIQAHAREMTTISGTWGLVA